MYPRSMADSDCVVVMGSNMAENHPVAFRWPMQAKVEHGAKIIHVDPRFTRTSAVADIYAPVRAGTDIAFLGGIINHVINSERWNTDPFFRSWVGTYTNAATLVSEEYQDAEDNGGVFSGLMEYRGGVPEWPYNGFTSQYDDRSWQYRAGRVGDQGRSAATALSGEVPGTTSGTQQKAVASGPPYDPLVRSLLKPRPARDETLQDPRCVFQIVKRHFSRYTPEMVERTTGCPRDTFSKIADTILANSGAERTTSFAYAVAWTQHTNGPQIIGCCALLQLLLGNFGRPGAGIMALRGHASIQGSTDVPTLYHSIHGYLPAPSALKKHDTLAEYLAAETLPTSYWANAPKFVVSYLKSMYGDAATAENDFGYAWHPRIFGDHSHMPMFVAMNEGKVKGMLCVGQNPATSIHAKLERAAMRKLEWLVVKDNWLHETANFWKTAPEVVSGEVKPQDIQTEVFFFPAAQVAETEGTFTNTQRMLQTHFKATEAPGDCRTDVWFTYQLGKRLKALYAGSQAPRDQGFKNLVFDYEHEDPRERQAGEPSATRLLKEMNGYYSADPARHVPGFAALADDGSTTCASWIYSGVFPAADRNLAAQQTTRPARPTRLALELGLRVAGQPTAALQPRLGRSLRQAMERAEEVDLVGRGEVERLRRPGFPGDQGPDRRGQARRHRTRRPFRDRPLHHEGGWCRLAVRAERAGGRPAADTIRSGRIAAAEPGLPAAIEPGAEILAGSGESPGAGRGSEIPLRDHDLPPDRALSLRRHEPMAAVARRTAARAVRGNQPRAGAGQGD